MGDKRDPQNKNEIYARSVRCPVHHAVIGKYDVRDGLINVGLFMPEMPSGIYLHNTTAQTVKKTS